MFQKKNLLECRLYPSVLKYYDIATTEGSDKIAYYLFNTIALKLSEKESSSK